VTCTLVYDRCKATVLGQQSTVEMLAKQRTDKHATMGSPCNSRGILGGVFFGVRSPAI
jgi:hypothetical protein